MQDIPANQYAQDKEAPPYNFKEAVTGTIEPSRENTSTNGMVSKQVPNQPVQSQKQARCLKFWI